MENQNYFEKILNGEMITEEVKTKRGVFTIKNLTSKDHIKIAVAKSKMLQGLDRRVDSPALSGRGSRPSGRTSG